MLAPSAGDTAAAGLQDDVLLRILTLVADARDAVRTGALSRRRWLGLLTYARLLLSASPLGRCQAASGAEQCAALERYVSFVNSVLARRTTQSDS